MMEEHLWSVKETLPLLLVVLRYPLASPFGCMRHTTLLKWSRCYHTVRSGVTVIAITESFFALAKAHGVAWLDFLRQLAGYDSGATCQLLRGQMAESPHHVHCRQQPRLKLALWALVQPHSSTRHFTVLPTLHNHLVCSQYGPKRRSLVANGYSSLGDQDRLGL